MSYEMKIAVLCIFWHYLLLRDTCITHHHLLGPSETKKSPNLVIDAIGHFYILDGDR